MYAFISELLADKRAELHFRVLAFGMLALLGFISNLVYLIYPAGLMWYQVQPFSYRVIQTLLFHGLMTIYGLLVLLFDDVRFDWKQCYMEPLCTIPEYRGRGLAAAALSEHCRRLKPLGAEMMTGGGGEFYKRIGYEDGIHWLHYRKK